MVAGPGLGAAKVTTRVDGECGGSRIVADYLSEQVVVIVAIARDSTTTSSSRQKVVLA